MKRRTDIDAKKIARRYLRGESEQAIALSLGVSRSVIRRLLLLESIEPRTKSQAMLCRAARMTKKQRSALIAPALSKLRAMREAKGK